MIEKDKENDVEILSEMVEDEGLFESRGYSVVKVTRDGKAGKLRLSISTRGVSDLMGEINAGAPRPQGRRKGF